jgi:hypothetical protein
MIPEHLFHTILTSKNNFQITKISKSNPKKETYVFASFTEPFEDSEVQIVLENKKVYVIPKLQIKKVKVLHVPKQHLDFFDDKLYRSVEGTVQILEPNVKVQISDDTILRTPTKVLIVNLPHEPKVVEDKGPPILTNFLPTIFGESTVLRN